MASSKRRYIGALWLGVPSETDDRVALIPGETVYAGVSEGEAAASDNWEPQYSGKSDPEGDV